MSEQPADRHEWVGAIVTVSGKSFDLLNPNPLDVAAHDIAHSLSLQCRYNGHVPTFYSVAEHSVRVSHWLAEHGGDEAVQLAGLLHDAAEAYCGDMVRPMKKLPELGALYDEIETKLWLAIAERFGLDPTLPALVDTADKAVFEWETDHIRTALTCGWTPEYAREAFLAHFDFLMEALR